MEAAQKGMPWWLLLDWMATKGRAGLQHPLRAANVYSISQLVHPAFLFTKRSEGMRQPKHEEISGVVHIYMKQIQRYDESLSPRDAFTASTKNARNLVRTFASCDGKEEEEEIIRLPCLVGRVVGPLLAARALPLRCAASTMLSSTLLAI
jgi:hypothetical protein